MIEKTRWFDRNLGSIGAWLTIAGAALLFLSYFCNVLFSTYWNRQASGAVEVTVMFIGFAYNIATTMMWCGVPLYCLGRLLNAGPITLVGFERVRPSELMVKGPDENHTVWIGRSYKDAFDAEVAAKAISHRLGTNPPL